MRWLLAVTICWAGCAPASTPGTAASGPNSVIPTGQHGMHVSMGGSAVATSHAVGAPPPAVWAALPAVYETLQIPVETLERNAYRLGNRQFQVSRRLGGEALSYYVDCGLGPAGVPLANTSRLTLSILTTLHPAGDSTEVRSEVTGTGRPLDSTGGDRVRCTTTGQLERRIAEMVRERVAR